MRLSLGTHHHDLPPPLRPHPPPSPPVEEAAATVVAAAVSAEEDGRYTETSVCTAGPCLLTPECFLAHGPSQPRQSSGLVLSGGPDRERGVAGLATAGCLLTEVEDHDRLPVLPDLPM